MKKIFLLSIMLVSFFAAKSQWSIEGTNDTKGIYENKKTMESWTIHFSDKKNDFVAFYSKMIGGTLEQDKPIVIDRVEKISKTVFKIHMKGIQGEKVPTWILKYNAKKKFYDLHTHSYDAIGDKWFDTVFTGNSNNG